MKIQVHTVCKQASLLLCALLLSACIAGPTANTLYTLRPDRQERMGQDFSGFRDIILIMPIRMAPHLQGRGLVNQRSATESKTSASHLWAGPLDQQIAENIVSNLKDLLGTDNVAVYPGPRFGATRYQVEIEISDFSGNEQSFTVRAVYTISDTAGKTMLHRKSFQETRVIDKPDYSGYVQTASQVVGALSREVAIALLASRQSHPVSPGAHEK
jgi:uncharacterized lipoprotein YmbA